MRAYKKNWKEYVTPEELAKKLGDRIRQSAPVPELMRDVLWEKSVVSLQGTLGR